ncbi:TPA: hypothetical protein MCW73_001753 [Klebsiella pneumoniae]|uniref:ATP-dependent RNA helicase HrpA n=1 Tax=Klebsiella variicola TaxID=244366 RepID=A0A9P3P580_KLEVA|nr:MULTISPECIES: hypothetical protein [Klebsiella]MDG5629741.1 hypothetical protein [Klebsiella pneumoniae]PLE73420.1 hypothetical protein B6I77_16365 [Klebsiella pneumoniae]PLH14105.1 hypothetical protein B6J23_20470 [Klebsiella pneumoniae]SXD51538.1 Uncharacterised protein [Klebsiella quasipneumoniae]GKJ89907.1 hypothetical protein NUKP37_15840 [Klebsiella variicola]
MTINKEQAVNWMLIKIQKDGCLYQDDVVDHLVKAKSEELLVENADGNLALSRQILNLFMKHTAEDVVWVKPQRYWRYRVAEDEPGREARG